MQRGLVAKGLSLHERGQGLMESLIGMKVGILGDMPCRWRRKRRVKVVGGR
jgi:hypothetical protein